MGCYLSIVAFSTCWWERKAVGVEGGPGAGRNSACLREWGWWGAIQ